MKKLVGLLALSLASGASVAAMQDSAASTREAVAFWTTGYAGSKLGSIGCVAPRLPDEAALTGTQRITIKAIEKWQDCHRRLIGALAPESAHKFIPAEVLSTMTPSERETAIRHVAAVHAKHAESVQADAAKLIAAQDAWRKAAKRYLDDYHDWLIAARSDR